jgi:hypothetical protein
LFLDEASEPLRIHNKTTLTGADCLEEALLQVSNLFGPLLEGKGYPNVLTAALWRAANLHRI